MAEDRRHLSRRAVNRGGRRQTDWPHATRQRYHRGCRCLPCRAANARYEYARWRGELGHLVPAEQAKRVLETMARLGVGRHRVAELAGISDLTVFRIRRGLTLRIHPDVESAILGVKPSLAHGCYVTPAVSYDAKRWLLSLLGEDYSPATIGAKIGTSPERIAQLAARREAKRLRVGDVLRLRALWQQSQREDLAG